MTKSAAISIMLANPRGFCAGVERAIDIVERALRKYGAPIYVKHEIVHNRHVVETLTQRGVVFVDDLKNVPEEAIVIFSAHGVSQRVEDEAKDARLKVIDATCPLVKKVHNEIVRHASNGRKIMLIGHEGHPEVEGTMGRVISEVFLIQTIQDAESLNFAEKESLAYVTQTTLSLDETAKITNALHDKYKNLEGPALQDICYATQNRQDAVKNIAQQAELLLVIGSQNSSNSNRLRELGESCGIPSYLIDNRHSIDLKWLKGKKVIGLTAGASTPEILIDEVLAFFKANYCVTIQELQAPGENVKFKMPVELRDI